MEHFDANYICVAVHSTSPNDVGLKEWVASVGISISSSGRAADGAAAYGARLSSVPGGGRVMRCERISFMTGLQAELTVVDLQTTGSRPNCRLLLMSLTAAIP